MAEQAIAASGIPSMWAPVLNGAIGIVAANHGAYKQYKYNSKLQKEAAKLNYKYAEKQLRNSPTWNRAGLESAGFNPMLAVQNATSGANSNWTSNSSVSAPDYSGLGVADTISNATRLKEIQNQTAQTESQIDLNDASAEESRAKAANYRAENPYISKREEANIRQTDAATTKLNSDTELNKATIENMESRLELDRELGFAGIDVTRQGNSIQSYNARTGRMAQELSREQFEGSQDKFMADFAKKHPYLYATYRHLDNAAGLAGRVMGATPSFSSSSNYNDYETHSVNYDRHGNVVGQKTTKHHSNSGSKKRSKK